jgi:hypothetical protein
MRDHGLSMRRITGLLIVIVLGAWSHIATASPWRIVKDHWSEADERGFGAFVEAIGESNCSSSESCLRNVANAYRNSDQAFIDIDVDCAKLPYLLRAYYAWKNGLPFSYVDAVNGGGGDLRFTKTSNRAASRHDVIDHGDGINAPRVISDALSSVFSGTYRTDAAEKNGILSDFYSPALKPGSIRPGTVVYDVNGHVGIVYKVDADGRIYYMDAHPDFSITRSVYGAQFGRSPAELGGGFKNWRPLQLVNAHADDGHLLGGHMAFAANDHIPDYSLVQYAGTEPNASNDVEKAKFAYDGAQLGFYEYVRASVSGGRTTFNPVYELQVTMGTLCNDLGDRAQSVDQAIAEGVQIRPHPDRLPENIYGSADNTWESYATPSRDARIKAAFAQFHAEMKEMIRMWINRDPRLVYDGYSLKEDLRNAYDAESGKCTISYLGSDKRPVAMTFDDMAHRLFAMSFDPYDCIELRWGADDSERSSCTNGPAKLTWYEDEQRLRNQTDRTDDISMNYSRDDLEQHRKGTGVDAPPSVDVKSLIETMGEQVSFTPMTPVGK